MRHILIIDNSLSRPCVRCYRFRENIKARYQVRVSAADKLPQSLSSFSHIILIGGSGRLDDGDPRAKHLKIFIRRAIREGVPLLGICFGHEAIAAAVSKRKVIEYSAHPITGWNRIRRVSKSRLLAGLPKVFYAFEHHHNDITHLPSDFIVTASSRRTKIEAFEHTSLPIFGVQFHSEIRRRRAQLLLKVFAIEKLPERWLASSDNRHFSHRLQQQIFHNFYELTKQ